MPGVFLSNIQQDLPDDFPKASNSRFKLKLWYLLLLIPLLFFIGMREDATPAKLVELPEKSPDFIGRKQELAMVEKRLLGTQEGGRSQLLAIYGEGGVGKSELAIAFGNDHVNHFSLIGWICGNSEESLDHSYARLGDVLDIHEEHPVRRREKIHRALESGGKKPWLLIFDDLCDLSFELPKTGGAVLITCRDKSLFPSHVTMELTKNPDDGLLLLSKLTGEPPSDALIQLAKQLDDLPLMINLAGHYIRETPGLNVSHYSKILSELIETEDSPLKWQEFGTRYSKSLMASYRTTLELLQKKHPLSFEFLRDAALFHNNIPNEFLVAWLEAKNQFTPAQITLLRGDILRELRNHSLIRYDEKNGEFSLHQLLYHALAINRVDSNIWVKILSEYGRVKAYNPTHIESIRPFQRVLPHVLKILDQVQQPDVPIVRLSLTVARYFIETEFQFQKGKIYLDLAEEWSKDFNHPIKGRIAFLQGMMNFRVDGEFHREKEEHEKLCIKALGYFERAFNIFQAEERDDLYLAIEQNPAKCTKEYQRAICKQFQGQILRVLGRIAEAEDKLNEAMQDFQAIAPGGDHFDIARIMREQALILWEKGYVEEAILLLENAILMQKRVYGDMYHYQPTAANTLRTLGDFYFQRGQFIKANEAYQMAIAISRPIFQSDEHPFMLELFHKQAKAAQALSH